jgi:hypothetical protein
MEFNLIGNTLVLSGAVVDADLAKTKDVLNPSKVKLIVMHHNVGGDLWNAIRIGERIRDSGIPTTISGLCISACGLIYLGGKTRTFSDGGDLDKMSVWLHGAISRDGKRVVTTSGPTISHYLATMTEGKYPDELMEKTVYSKSPDNYITVSHPRQYTFIGPPGRKGISECLVSVKFNVANPESSDVRSKCSIQKGHDAISIGVITDTEITQLDQQVKDFLRSL